MGRTTKKGTEEIPCLSTVVKVMYPGRREPMEVRIVHGIYCKQGCGDIAEKMHLLQLPIVVLSEWMVEYPERSADICNRRVDIDVMCWQTRLPGVVEVNGFEGWRGQGTHADKSVFFSFYMGVIDNVIKVTTTCGGR